MSETFNRGTGLVIIEVRASNPNGDPDAEGEPRTTGANRRGLISPVSFKRKLRDLVADAEGPAFQAASTALGLDRGHNRFGILEARHRKREEITRMGPETFIPAYWDARVFGNTFLESMKGKDVPKGPARDHFISTGAVQFGPGISVSPIDIEYGTLTNKAGVEDDKDRGMAPLAWRFVPHAIYVMPFFVNPLSARKSGCTAEDIELMKFMIPLAYRATASVARPDVEILHAWYAEHRSPVGSCPDWQIVDALTPARIADPDHPSTSRADYRVPSEADLSAAVRGRLQSVEDLCLKEWADPVPA